ncbi:serine hydrolase domain-containing protein [Allosediminivita pacifica]|uniref:Beta-lactamase-related domain-containing protein n=1 Tax=Allosediminivita pacifica TaxID=1267769 RepID=A0A2T6ABH9_9RHOB|nr:serine hydrolase [Allosediminivita pacifica]PTX41174.1 hypothetical protein C8N44_13115 [Allosediminivita pacifica]
MPRVLRITAIVLAVLIGAIALGAAWNWQQVKRLHAVVTLFDPERIVHNFSHMDELFASVPVLRGDGPSTPLPPGRDLVLPEGWEDWLEERSVTSVVVLHDGTLVHESYELGTGENDLRISWSVAKSFLSLLFGVVLEQGRIDSLDDPVTKYAPELEGSAYDGATIRNVLQMSTGVVFDEDYMDFWSDINRMGRVLALGRSMDGFAASLDETDMEPGSEWRYVSIDTHVLGMVLRGATRRSIPDLMSEYIIQPLGVEREPYYVTDGEGVAFVLGGLNMMTRDYARMGQMVLRDGRVEGEQVVPEAWIRESTTASASTAPGALRYGYQWWMPADAEGGELLARGVYGQYVYIDPASDVVIATTGADRDFRKDGAFDQSLGMFRQVADQLSEAP